MRFSHRSWAEAPRLRRRQSNLRAGLSLALLLVATPAAIADWAHAAGAPITLPELMQGFARARGVRAHFVEQKHLELLVEPLESEGMLYFSPPDRLARHIERPGPAAMIIHGERLVMRDASGVDRVDLGQSDVARQFVDSFIVLFNGDLAGLERRYRVEYASDAAGWRIALAPRDGTLRRMIESIVLQGRGFALERMEVVETQGDRSVTRFDRIEANHSFSDEEVSAVLALGEPSSHD